MVDFNDLENKGEEAAKGQLDKRFDGNDTQQDSQGGRQDPEDDEEQIQQ